MDDGAREASAGSRRSTPAGAGGSGRRQADRGATASVAWPSRLHRVAIAAAICLVGLPQESAAQLTIKEDNQWRYALGLGASWASGNSDSKSVNVTADAVRATEYDKWTLYGRMLYGEDDNQTTSDQLSAGVRYDWDISPKWFHFGILDWLRDRPANLIRRISVNSGLGYHFYKRDDGFWDGFAGLGYSHDDLVVQTEVANAQRSNYGRAELLIGEQSEHRISDTATLKSASPSFRASRTATATAGSSTPRCRWRSTGAST